MDLMDPKAAIPREEIAPELKNFQGLKSKDGSMPPAKEHTAEKLKMEVDEFLKRFVKFGFTSI